MFVPVASLPLAQVAASVKMGSHYRMLRSVRMSELCMTTLEYLQCLRIESAKLLLENTQRPLAQVVADVGFLMFGPLRRCSSGRLA